ncbi:hypothetical protein SAMN05660653_01119 [Desulfonatronum thiosulfatophilum]|uniref:Uncharacterized protein n=1 Tax=Desulfonatronum thiosulfatophilum TaxID=617002 RepID=A0A1G6BQL4_9BACT|nr:hypothetical protein [Desulfonatronum thiosulfatophilum]SDB22903.1 hypothetical protein SAMN05660653_01119 [Desulfonatronum thiosulfatophilum]
MHRPIVVRILRTMLLLILGMPLLACGPSGPRSVYPPPDILRMADDQRHEFIQLFLQGRWCEAQSMFERSRESYLMQDDFCAAAQNELIAWKLKQYLDITAGEHLHAARELVHTGLECPELHLPGDWLEPQPPAFSARDENYRQLMVQRNFSALANQLRNEPDPLYASVYGRKAALTALVDLNMEQARSLIMQTRDLDARQGWIVFLIEDWNIIHSLNLPHQNQQEILHRIERLQNLIQPCRF